MNTYYETLNIKPGSYEFMHDMTSMYMKRMERMIKHVRKEHMQQPYTLSRAKVIYLIEHHMSMIFDHLETMEYDMVENGICEPGVFKGNEMINDVYFPD